MTEKILDFDEALALILDDPEQFASYARQNPEVLRIRGLHNETLLHFTAVEGELLAVATLLRLGSDVNSVNRLGTTALIDAVVLGNQPMVRFLLKHDANLNFASKGGMTALHYAAEFNHRVLFDLLLSHGADPDAIDDLGCKPDELW